MQMVINVLALSISKTESVSLEMLVNCSPSVASFLHQYPGASYLLGKVDSSLRRRKRMGVPAAAATFAMTFAITCQSPIATLEVPVAQVPLVALWDVFRRHIAGAWR